MLRRGVGNCVPFLFAIRLDILIQTMYNLVMELKEATKMMNLADAHCNYAEAMTVFSDDISMEELRARAIVAKYPGLDVATGDKIEVGERIASLGTGWTHVVDED